MLLVVLKIQHNIIMIFKNILREMEDLFLIQKFYKYYLN